MSALEAAPPRSRLWPQLRQEGFLGLSLATSLAFLLQGESIFAWLANPVGLGVVFLWLFAVVLGSAFAVVRHAEKLAIRLGEPYGTLILTLSVTAIEVMSISAVVVNGRGDPTLTRDTLFSVLMVLLNGMVGLSLLVGAWRRREQVYNLQGANAYLGLIIPLAVLCLILPDFTQTTPGPTISASQTIFLIVMVSGLYVTFVALQTSRHRGFFAPADAETSGHGDRQVARPSLPRHALLLGLYMIPVVFLAEQLAHPLDHIIEMAQAPRALGGLIIAVLVASPEAVGAVRAALANQLQRAVNIFLGSVLSTIGLTAPVMLALSLVTGQDMVLGLQHTDFVLLLLTLAVSLVTFASGRTNVLQGAVHLLLFAAYLLLIFEN